MKRLLSLSLCIACFTATAQQQIVTCQFPIEIEYEEEGLDLVWNTGDAGSSLLVNGPGHYSVSAITTNRLLDGTGQDLWKSKRFQDTSPTDIPPRYGPIPAQFQAYKI